MGIPAACSVAIISFVIFQKASLRFAGTRGAVQGFIELRSDVVEAGLQLVQGLAVAEALVDHHGRVEYRVMGLHGCDKLSGLRAVHVFQRELLVVGLAIRTQHGSGEVIQQINRSG